MSKGDWVLSILVATLTACFFMSLYLAVVAGPWWGLLAGFTFFVLVAG